MVSTHSRLKAAGIGKCLLPRNGMCFNTQPPEGGWLCNSLSLTPYIVSTHSRLKAAGKAIEEALTYIGVSTHSRLKAAGTALNGQVFFPVVSTHSRLKAAG